MTLTFSLTACETEPTVYDLSQTSTIEAIEVKELREADGLFIEYSVGADSPSTVAFGANGNMYYFKSADSENIWDFTLDTQMTSYVKNADGKWDKSVYVYTETYTATSALTLMSDLCATIWGYMVKYDEISSFAEFTKEEQTTIAEHLCNKYTYSLEYSDMTFNYVYFIDYYTGVCLKKEYSSSVASDFIPFVCTQFLDAYTVTAPAEEQISSSVKKTLTWFTAEDDATFSIDFPASPVNATFDTSITTDGDRIKYLIKATLSATANEYTFYDVCMGFYDEGFVYHNINQDNYGQMASGYRSICSSTDGYYTFTAYCDNKCSVDVKYYKTATALQAANTLIVEFNCSTTHTDCGTVTQREAPALSDFDLPVSAIFTWSSYTLVKVDEDYYLYVNSENYEYFFKQTLGEYVKYGKAAASTDWGEGETVTSDEAEADILRYLSTTFYLVQDVPENMSFVEDTTLTIAGKEIAVKKYSLNNSVCLKHATYDIVLKYTMDTTNISELENIDTTISSFADANIIVP